jgi:hypothetical protein
MFNKAETIQYKGKPGKSKRQANNIFSKKGTQNSDTSQIILMRLN